MKKTNTQKSCDTVPLNVEDEIYCMAVCPGAHIIYNMWKNVGRRPTFLMIGESETKKEKNSQRCLYSTSFSRNS